MTGRKQRTLDEQLAEARAKQQKVAERLRALETRRKARDARTRARAEKLLLKILLDGAAAHPAFRNELQRVVATAALTPDERQMIIAYLATLGGKTPSSAPTPPAARTPPEPPKAHTANVPPRGHSSPPAAPRPGPTAVPSIPAPDPWSRLSSKPASPPPAPQPPVPQPAQRTARPADFDPLEDEMARLLGKKI